MKRLATNPDASAAQRKSDGLHLLAVLAESEGRMDAATALAKWADSTAPFIPCTDAEIRAMRPQGKSGAR